MSSFFTGGDSCIFILIKKIQTKSAISNNKNTKHIASNEIMKTLMNISGKFQCRGIKVHKISQPEDMINF